VAREITEEFVRHFRHLVERTGNHPSAVMRALDKHPELAISLERLRAIAELVEHHRKFSERRFIDHAHPGFRKALSDFKEHWAAAPRTYAVHRYWLAVVKDFLRHYRVLVEKTEDRPSQFRKILDEEGNLGIGSSISTLHEIQEIVIANSRRSELFQAYPEFSGGVHGLRRALERRLQ
jgi:hypothetical protein